MREEALGLGLGQCEMPAGPEQRQQRQRCTVAWSRGRSGLRGRGAPVLQRWIGSGD